ncbi:MAG: XRE family transcriptional regulator [Alphaproteobacteria bacterium]
MTPNDLREWMAAMGFKSQAKAAEALGVSAETFGNWLAGKRRDGKPAAIDERTALACAALYHRLEPWGAASRRVR